MLTFSFSLSLNNSTKYAQFQLNTSDTRLAREAHGQAVLPEALWCKCGRACPVINRGELRRSAVQMQVTQVNVSF